MPYLEFPFDRDSHHLLLDYFKVNMRVKKEYLLKHFFIDTGDQIPITFSL